ncbi:MAG: PIG-L deacetylase family protein [Longimicrobiaceae bacterium]
MEDRPLTLLLGLAHPDDEVGAAGTVLAQRARGDRVVIVWLTRGELTDAYGNGVAPDEVARRRTALGEQAGRVLDAETRFLDFPDTRVRDTPEAVEEVAQLVAELRPDAVLTWGDAWHRGMRHPDHQRCGRVFRDAVTVARIRHRVRGRPPHRGFTPVFTYRDEYSALPATAVDVEPHLDAVRELARLYHDELSFGDPGWLEKRLRETGERWGAGWAEEFDAWETLPRLAGSLLPATPSDSLRHPEREEVVKRAL